MYKTFKEFHNLKNEDLRKWLGNLFSRKKPVDPEEKAYFQRMQSQLDGQPGQVGAIGQQVFKDNMQRLLQLLPGLPEFDKLPAGQREAEVRNWLYNQPVFKDKAMLRQALDVAHKAAQAANQISFPAGYARVYHLATALQDRLEQMDRVQQPQAEFEPDQEGGFKPMPPGWDVSRGGRAFNFNPPGDLNKVQQKSMDTSDKQRHIINATRDGVPDQQIIQWLMANGMADEKAARTMINKVRKIYHNQ